MSAKLMLPAAVALTLRFCALGSFEQSGKALLFAVRQTRTLPFLLRSPETETSKDASADAFAATPLIKAAKAKIGAAKAVPKPEI